MNTKTHSQKKRRPTSHNTEQVTGTVIDVLPKHMFWVVLEDGRKVRASLSATSRHSIVKLLVGDQVSVRLASSDPSRGQIVRKIA